MAFWSKDTCGSTIGGVADGVGIEVRIGMGVAPGGYGYSVQKSIAFGYLPIEVAKPGLRLEVELFGEQIPLTEEKEPLFDPKQGRIMA